MFSHFVTKLLAGICFASSIALPALAQFRDFKIPSKAISPDRLREIVDPKGIVVPDGPIGRGFPVSPPAPPSPAPTPVPRAEAPAPFEAAQERLTEEFNPRVVGGEMAFINEHPWQAALIVGTTPPEIRVPFCGASIVAPQWILTAAHCMRGVKGSADVNVVTGTTWPRFSGQGDRIQVTKIVLHPQYNSSTYEHDIALLRLERPIKLGRVLPLAPKDLMIPVNALVIVSGWGAVVQGATMSDQLLKAEMPIVANATCNEPASYNGAISAGMLCAGYREGGVDACQGDSGGPLTAPIKGTQHQIGIVSWGRGCALKLKYGVYTRVPTYVDWANAEMKKTVVATR